MRINTPLIDAMSQNIVPMNAVPMNVASVHLSTSLQVAAAPASSVTCAGAASGVQGTTVSSASALVSLAGAGVVGLAVEAIRVKAAVVFTLKPLGYGDEQVQRQTQVQMREERVDGSDSTIGSDSGANDSTTRDNGTNPFGPWDFRTSSPPG